MTVKVKQVRDQSICGIEGEEVKRMGIIHKHYKEVEPKIPDEKGAERVTVRWLISKKDGARNFAMRLFELESGGCSPYHRHDWEHEVFILEGKGKVVTESGEEDLNPGDFVFIPSMEWHQFKNDDRGTLKFLCLVPLKE